MYKIVFIDDEFLVLEGLKRIINWSDYHIEVAGEEQDAHRGIELVERVKPEIIISDIKMHGMDGLEMIKKLRSRGYDGYVILLTGYQEFEYAKRAIENKVYSYLLKPIDIDELTEIIKQIVAELDQKRVFKVEGDNISEVVCYINEHFYDEIQLSELADKFHFEVSHLSRQLKKKLGMNYIEYLAQLRIGAACEYMTKTNLSFNDISRRVGYNDVRRFREMFKKKVGMSPSEYKHQMHDKMEGEKE